MDFASIASALSSVKVTFDLLSSAIETRDQAKLYELRLTLNKQLMDVFATASMLQEKLIAKGEEHSQLKEHIRNLTQQLNDLQRYKTHHFETGTVAFVDSHRQVDDPVAYFCAACMSEHKKTILQIRRNKLFLSCPFGHPDIAISDESQSFITLSSTPRTDFSGY